MDKNRIKINESKLFKILLMIALIINDLEYYSKMIYLQKKAIKQLKIFIMTHKDFNNLRKNKIYNIVADDNSQLKNKYNLNVIYADKGELYKLRRGYGEMSKLYFIFQLYKNKSITSKYIGLNHYNRYFIFKDNIPNLDDIFENYDAILNEPLNFDINIRDIYCITHICNNFDEILEIIKEIKPLYYETALEVANSTDLYACNMFIMKKEDFLNYCTFIFDILLEFDKRNNFTSDDDVLRYVKKYFNDSRDVYYQSRMQGFLAERIGTIFFMKYFKKIKQFNIIYKNRRYLNQQ